MNNLNCVKKQESEKEETTDSNAKDFVQDDSEKKETEEKMEIKRKNSNSKTREDPPSTKMNTVRIWCVMKITARHNMIEVQKFHF